MGIILRKQKMVTNAKKHMGKKAKKSPYFTSHKVKIKRKKASNNRNK